MLKLVHAKIIVNSIERLTATLDSELAPLEFSAIKLLDSGRSILRLLEVDESEATVHDSVVDDFGLSTSKVALDIFATRLSGVASHVDLGEWTVFVIRARAVTTTNPVPRAAPIAAAATTASIRDGSAVASPRPSLSLVFRVVSGGASRRARPIIDVSILGAVVRLTLLYVTVLLPRRPRRALTAITATIMTAVILSRAPVTVVVLRGSVTSCARLRYFGVLLVAFLAAHICIGLVMGTATLAVLTRARSPISTITTIFCHNFTSLKSFYLNLTCQFLITFSVTSYHTN